MLEKFTKNAIENITDYPAYMVRTRDAGVFFGQIENMMTIAEVCLMSNARRVWYWDGAASLSQLAMDGTTKPESCKFPCAVPEVMLFGVIEILPISEKALASLNSVEIWAAE